jgi:hypothetical protein
MAHESDRFDLDPKELGTVSAEMLLDEIRAVLDDKGIAYWTKRVDLVCSFTFGEPGDTDRDRDIRLWIAKDGKVVFLSTYYGMKISDGSRMRLRLLEAVNAANRKLVSGSIWIQEDNRLVFDSSLFIDDLPPTRALLKSTFDRFNQASYRLLAPLLEVRDGTREPKALLE